MIGVAQQALRWIAEGADCAIIEIAEAQGSTPREAGAFMAATLEECAGTIGGGQMEFHAIDRARALLREGRASETIDVALGPHLGQCCGGRVVITLRRAAFADAQALAGREDAEARPDVFIFGAGHTGFALTQALALLPVRVRLVDDRPDLNPHLPDGVVFHRLEDPAEALGAAPAQSAFVILTHSHALDYRLTDAALRRDDAAYVGMIGSATKLARFRQWFRARGGEESLLAQLVCPIGGKAAADKRPGVIAALTAAELIHRFFAAKGVGNQANCAAETNQRGKAA